MEHRAYSSQCGRRVELNEEETEAQNSTVLKILNRMRPQREHMASAAALLATVNGNRIVEDLHAVHGQEDGVNSI